VVELYLEKSNAVVVMCSSLSILKH